MLGSTKDLLSAIVQNHRINHKSRRDPLRYGWVHLPTTRVKITVSAINLVGRDPFRYKWVHLLATIVKNNSISHQSSRDPLRHAHLQAAIIKNNSISHQSSRDPLRYESLHLRAAIFKNSISHQSRTGTLRYGWVHLRAAIVISINISQQCNLRHRWVSLLPVIARDNNIIN